ncbi:MAG: HlyD family efflux transporter periplasmic adaptor subunit [Burkholderiaceae bacterium]|nr:HlyD family efflux transporter periplasmic adaptor subunit [Burkholderiaceae bacterium]
MTRRNLGLSIAAGLVLAALLGWAFAPRPLEVETARARVGAFEATIDEDARTRLAERYLISAPLAGQLQRVTLREGDPVAAGQVVATLLPALPPLFDERTRRELEARVAVAEASLVRARTAVEAAGVTLQQASTELTRTEALARQGFVAPNRIDADRLAAQAAARQRDSAVAGEQVARQELEQARAALGVVRAGAAGGAAPAFALRSPVAGRVLRLRVQSEAALTLGTPVLEVGDVAALEIVAELLTTDAVQTAPGSAVHIERWGGPGLLQGRVRRVEPAGFTKVSALGVEEQRVNVVIDFTSPRAQWAALGDGYRVGVRIVTISRPEVLTVPVSAVFPLPAAAAASAAVPGAASAAAAAGAASGAAMAHAVFRVEGGRARLQPVELAARNGSLAWIRQGLAAGAQVIVYPPAGVADGVRVAERAPA